MSKDTNTIEYTSKCSEKTLQSNDSGFFLSFADNLAEIAGQIWIVKKFGILRSDAERLKIIFEHEPVKTNMLAVLSNIQELYRKKSPDVASTCRKKAEKANNENKLSQSLSLFSQSILRANSSGCDLSMDNADCLLPLALFGRAGVLMELEKYDYALNDLKQALKENLPESTKAQAYLRLAVCYKALKEDKKAEIAFGLSKNLFKSSEDREILIARYRNEVSKTSRFQKKLKEKKDSPKIFGKGNAVFPNAVDDLTVRSSANSGRFVVSKGNIKTGDTLVVESPYAACLVSETFGSHCQNCFERLVAPIGCLTCSNVAFCGTVCRDEAMKTYHKYECKIMGFLQGSGMSVLAFLALRMVTQKSLKENLEMYTKKNTEHIFSLCTNAEKRCPQDFFRRTVMAAFLLRCLRVGGYFIDHIDQATSDDSPTEKEFVIGEMLLYNLQMLQFNAHEIYEKIHDKGHRFKRAKINCVGVGLFPTVALFNHQCYPAVTRYFLGKTIVINAIRPIGPEEVVAENYGPIFTKKPLNVRQKILLSRYWFKCECSACMQDWPMFNSEFTNETIRLRCPTENCNNSFSFSPQKKRTIYCPNCGGEVDLREALKKLEYCKQNYIAAFEKMDDMDTKTSINMLKESLNTFHSIALPPHKETHLAEETLKACFADLGNKFEIDVEDTKK